MIDEHQTVSGWEKGGDKILVESETAAISARGSAAAARNKVLVWITYKQIAIW